MTNKIFEGLKQAYSPLGLGDAFLKGQAESLAAMGFVTDENLASVITAQRSFLESVQKSNDKRVADAMKKAQEEQAKAAAEAAQRQAELQKKIDDATAKIEELRKTTKTPPPTDKDDNGGIPEWYKQQMEAEKAQREALRAAELERQKILDEQLKAQREAAEAARKKEREEYEAAQNERFDKLQEQLQQLTGVNKTLKEDLGKMQAEKDAAEKAAAAKARQDSIIAKARELNIPEYRIQEGFSIADDADDAKISEYLTGISTNIKNNQLPNKGSLGNIQYGDKAAEKAETDDIAASLVGGMTI